MPRKRLELNLKPREKKELERTILQSWKNDPRIVLRCKIILMTEQGIPLQQIADDLSLSKTTVNAWRQVFKKKRIKGLKVRNPVGRPPKKRALISRSIQYRKDKSTYYITETYFNISPVEPKPSVRNLNEAVGDTANKSRPRRNLTASFTASSDLS
jgi:hypothetical protein